MKSITNGDGMSAVVRRYEELTVLDTETHFSIESKVSNRARKYLRFFNFLIKFGRVDETGFMMFPKRLAMEFVGDGDRNDLYTVNRVLDEVRKLDFVWRTKIPDREHGEEEIILKGNPMTFTVTAEKRGYAGVRFDPMFLTAIRDPNRPQVEMLFAYSFLLAEADYAYEHAQLFSKIWSREVEQKKDLQEVLASIELAVYRKAINAEKVHPLTRNLTDKITKKAIEAINTRTRFTVTYKVESFEKEKGKTRTKATHITFTIRLKKSYQLELNFDQQRLETLDSHLQEVVDFDGLQIPSRKASKLIPAPPTTIDAFTSDNEQLLEVAAKIQGVGVDEAILIDALNTWQPIGVVETWEAFDKQRNNSKAKPIENQKAYLISLLKSGKARKTREQRQQERAAQAKALEAAKGRDAQKGAYQKALEYLYYQRRFNEARALEGDKWIAEVKRLEDQEQLKVNFLEQAELSRYAKKGFEKDGWDCRLCRLQIETFSAQTLSVPIMNEQVWFEEEGRDHQNLSQAFLELKDSYKGRKLEDVASKLFDSENPDFERAAASVFS